MRQFKPVLSGKGMLAAAVAMLSGQALAETAGKVSFVTGDVTVTATNGSSRGLVRGDAINGGDRITTRAGRVQIRFVDGGFVSLQPNSVFGVDEYLYANRKPEETSLFFSLLQGGMRTITGTIGKVNKKSYQVRTPVATIGIRGTEYLASLTADGLVVSVGSGFVNVANNNGEITGGAGQNIHVKLQDKPRLGKDPAIVLASGVEGDRDGERDAEERRRQERLRKTIAIGDIMDANGEYILVDGAPASLRDSDPVTGLPYYVIDSPALFDSLRGQALLADFDQNGAATGNAGALLRLFGNGDGIYSLFETGTLHVVNVGTLDALSWGEFTEGNPTVNNVFNACGSTCAVTLPLPANEYLPYIIGLPAPSNLGKGTATYTLQGGTAPRDLGSGTAGRLDNLRITVDLDFATVDAYLKLTMPATAVSTSNTFVVETASPVALLNLGTAQNFQLNSSQLDVSDSNGVCASSGGFCSATLSAFFAGTGAAQMGVSYRIDNVSDLPNIAGVAALGLSGYNSSGQFADGPGYSVAYAYPGLAGLSGGTTGYDTPPFPDQNNGLVASFDSGGLLLEALDPASGAPILARGANTLADDEGKAGVLTWGRWYTTGGGDITVENATVSLASNDYLHYIAGPMTQYGAFDAIVSNFGDGATATYTFQGGTTATGTDGSLGKITSGSKFMVTFGALPSLTMDLGIDMNSGSDYRVTSFSTPGTPISVDATAAKFFADSTTTSCSASAGGSGGGCTASIQGFFAGQQAQQIGMSYKVSEFGTVNRTVTGAGAFGRGSITKGPTNPVLVAGQ